MRWRLPRVLHALALAYVVARLTPREAPWMHTLAGRVAGGGGTAQPAGVLPRLVPFLGGDRRVPLLATSAMWLDPPLIAGGCAILLWFGAWRDRGRDRPMPKLALPARSGELA